MNDLKLVNYLKMPSEVWGFLEWATGIIRLNLTQEDFDSMLSNVIEEGDFRESLNHEYFHLLQISTSGYLYYFVTELLVDIIPYWKTALTGQAKGMDIFKSTVENIPELNKKIKNRFAEIDKPNKNGITTRQIIEGWAFLFQKNQINPLISADSFKNELKYYESDYSASYHFLETIFQDKAKDYLPLISYISLCFNNPADFFHDYCSLLLNESNCKSISNNNAFLIAEKLRDKYFYFGTPIEVEKYLYKRNRYNPFYEKTIADIINYCTNNNLDFFSLMTDSKNINSHFEKLNLKCPIIFNPENIYIPYHEDESVSINKQKFKSTNLLVLSTLCLIIYKNNANGPKYLKKK